MRTAIMISGLKSGLEGSTRKNHDLKSVARMNNFLRGVEQRAFVVARLATQDDDEALDIVQDAMLKLAQKYLDRPDVEWGALFHTILHSRVNDWHRRQKVRNRWRVFFFAGKDDEDDADPEDFVPQTQFAEPDRQLLQDENSLTIQQAVGELPLRQQQALLLRAWEGFDIAETAEIMQCSQGSVKTHYSRAIHSLRKKLGDYQ